MSSLKASFTGSIVADPELKETKNGNQKLEFPVYINHAKKSKDTGDWVKTGDVTKIRVTLWGDRTQADLRKGDLVSITATLVDKEFLKRDGTDGRSLQTDYVEDIAVKHRKDAAAPLISSRSAFDDESPFL